MSRLTIPNEDALNLYHGQNPSDIINGVRFAAKNYSGEWRWGITYQFVIQDVVTEKYYEIFVNEQSGDHWYLSLEEEGEDTSFEEVIPVVVTTTEYRKPEYANS